MKNSRLLMGLLLLVLLLNMDITIFSVVLAPIASSLHLSIHAAAWIFSIYLLFFAAFIVLGGRLGDKYGSQLILTIGLLVFIVSSILAALANHLWILLIARALLAISAALTWPNITVNILHIFPTKKQAFALSLIATLVGVGQAIGPVVGGVILHWLSWQWIFWLNVPLGILSLISVYFAPAIAIERHPVSLPLINVLLLTLGLASLALGINQLPANAAWHSDALYLLAFAAIGLIGFTLMEKYAKNALLNHRLLKNKQFLQACLFRVLTVIVIYSVLFVVGIFLQQHWQLSVLQTSRYFLAMTVSIALMSPLAGKLIDRFGAKPLLGVAASCNIIGAMWLINIVSGSQASTIMIPLIFMGIGFACAGPAVLTLAMQTVPAHSKGAASGIFYMLSLISGLIIVAIDSNFISMQHSHTVNVAAVQQSFIVIAIASVLVLLALLLQRIFPGKQINAAVLLSNHE